MVKVEITDKFVPSQAIVRSVGETVCWTNNDTSPHTVTFNVNNDLFPPSSGQIAPGESFDATFSGTGTFRYHCSNHPGMQGSVEVVGLESNVPDSPNPAELIAEQQSHYGELPPINLTTHTKVIKHRGDGTRGEQNEIVRR